MTPPPTKITEPGSSRSLSISSEVIMCSAPGIGSWRGFDPVAITMCLASRRRSPTRIAFGPVALDHLDIATRHRARKVRRDILDQVLFAVDQCGPAQLRLADGDMMNGGALVFVQRVAGGDQNFLRRAAAVRAGPAEIVRFDHRDRHSSASHRTGNANAGVAA